MQALIQMGALPSPAHIEAQVSEKGDTPLLFAARNGNIEHVQLLLAAKANVDWRNNGGASALFLACQGGHAACANALIKAGSVVDAMSTTQATPSFIAAQKGHADCLQLLIEAKANLNIPAQVSAVAGGGHSPLDMGSLSRQLSNVSTESIEGGMGADGRYVMPSKSGVTPTFIAAQQGNVDALRLLIKARANIDTPTNGGVTPVCIAAAEGHGPSLQALIDAGANVNTVTTGGVTPVYIAAQKGQAESLRILVNASANCNTPTNDGSSAVFIAAQEGHLDCVRELIVGGAVLDRKYQGKTPKQIAKVNKHLAVAAMISDTIKSKAR